MRLGVCVYRNAFTPLTSTKKEEKKIIYRLLRGFYRKQHQKERERDERYGHWSPTLPRRGSISISPLFFWLFGISWTVRNLSRWCNCTLDLVIDQLPFPSAMAPQNDPFNFKYFKFLRSIENYRVRKIIKMRQFLKNERPSVFLSPVPTGQKIKIKKLVGCARAHPLFVCYRWYQTNASAVRPSGR